MFTQADMEHLYSNRQVHRILHAAIAEHLDGFLLNWTLKMWYRLENYLNDSYYESKNKRIKELKTFIDSKGIEYILVRLLAALFHTKNEQTYQQVIGYLQAYLPFENTFTRALTAGEIIALGASDNGLYSIVKRKGDTSIVQVNHWSIIEKEFLSAFDWINTTYFNPPLIEPPIPVVDNYNCGYHTIREPVILGQFTMHDEPQNLQNLNYLNEIQWVIDKDVLQERELPKKPFSDEQAKENFIQMIKESQFIYSIVRDRTFWLTWQYCSRGRSYSHGYHVNVQASEYKKALLNFNKYEVLTE